MPLSAKFCRKQLELVQPLLNATSLEHVRRGQDKLGVLMAATKRKQVTVENVSAGGVPSAMITPKDETRRGVLLYLHGGGYCCGDLEYAAGVGAVLASECGIRTLAPAYRLAPEHPYPAAPDDALRAYRYLLAEGYTNSEIVLCGESAGGGLIFTLCRRLRMEGLPPPAGVIAISPWSDLTASGNSYRTNEKNDPSLTEQRLDRFADAYTTDRKNPEVSPLFSELRGTPRTLIFVGGDEIMLDDATQLHDALLRDGVRSELVVAPHMWHAYILYNLREREEDITRINAFLSEVLPRPHKLRWMRLDNAAKLYPAARNRNWSNVFRLSATMSEPVNCEILQSALDVTARRFPSMAVRLCTGAFWYYLEEVSAAPSVGMDYCYPLRRMGKRETRRCAVRVHVYGCRIAVEIFHSVTDGTGGLIFLKSLLAEYIEQRYGVNVPATQGVLDRRQPPREEELEDSFLKYSGDVSIRRDDTDAFAVTGKKEERGVTHVVCLRAQVSEVKALAKQYGVSVTVLCCAIMMQALMRVQEKQIEIIRRRKPVRVLVPVNLRNLFESHTLRNFALYAIPEVNPRMGEYTFEEICRAVTYHMGMELTAKRMAAHFTTNVNDEKHLIIKVMPLFIKNIVMKMVFNAVGERTSCLTMSNLGAVQLPEEMKAYVRRFDFILSAPSSRPYNCGIISYEDNLYINFIRNTREPVLEAAFHEVARELGLHLRAESNASALERAPRD
ncbi:MAG: alpha/beta hydrolase [Clostridia bacterium]|nr:alpha/beta hydrolase [Clostridia bacterium]